MAKAIESRLVRLEARRKPVKRDKAKADLLERLGRLEQAVLATGDLSDRPGASLIERTVRRYMRGETHPTDALRDLLERRWP